jgi:hypothetical protein
MSFKTQSFDFQGKSTWYSRCHGEGKIFVPTEKGPTSLGLQPLVWLTSCLSCEDNRREGKHFTRLLQINWDFYLKFFTSGHVITFEEVGLLHRKRESKNCSSWAPRSYFGMDILVLGICDYLISICKIPLGYSFLQNTFQFVILLSSPQSIIKSELL